MDETPPPTGQLSDAACARLAQRVDDALDLSDRLLFVVTPREELEAVAQWQRLADQAWCGQLREVVASTARMSAADRDFAGDELALALGVGPMTGRALVWEYGSIAALPGLVEAVETGPLSVRHLKACVGALDEVSLSLEQRQAVVMIALTRFHGQTPGEWADVVRRLTLSIDPQCAARRRAEKTEQRHCRFYPQPDEQGAMWLQAPVEQLARAQARLHAEALRLKTSGDPRSLEQLECDIALALLTDGTLGDQPVAPYDVHVIVPLATLEPTGDQAAEDGGAAGGGADSATGPGGPAPEDLLGEIPGWGPISANTARELAQQAGRFSQVIVDDDGQVIDLSDAVRADRLPDLPTAPPAAAGGDQLTPTTPTAAESASDSTLDSCSDSDSDSGADHGDSTERRPAATRSHGGTDEPIDPGAVTDDTVYTAGTDVAPEATGDTAAPATSATPGVPDEGFLLRAVLAMRRPHVPRQLGRSGYRPGRRLTRFLHARDRTCVFPGCHRPAMRTDLDHRDPWPHGPTGAENMQCLCRHHHRAKHAIFTTTLAPDGTTLWTTRGGQVFRRPPARRPAHIRLLQGP